MLKEDVLVNGLDVNFLWFELLNIQHHLELILVVLDLRDSAPFARDDVAWTKGGGDGMRGPMEHP